MGPGEKGMVKDKGSGCVDRSRHPTINSEAQKNIKSDSYISYLLTNGRPGYYGYYCTQILRQVGIDDMKSL